MHSRGATSQYITPIANNPGLLTEEIADLRTSSIYWKIINRIDLTSHFALARKIEERIKVAEKMCNVGSVGVEGCDITDTSIIRSMLTNARQQLSHITLKIQKSDSVNNRKKRSAPLAFMGKLGKILFGSMTEDDGAILENMIEKASNDTRLLAQLMANQTDIIDTKLQDLDVQITRIDAQLSHMEVQSKKNHQEIHMLSYIEQLLAIVTQYEIDTNTLTQAILFASEGIIHPNLLTNKQILESIKLMKQTIEIAEFPLEETDNLMKEIEKISKLSIYFSKERLVYIIRIPLLDLTKFTLYKTHPFPIKQNLGNLTQIFTWVWPTYEFIAISNSNEEFIALNARQIATCKKTDFYICDKVEPVQDIHRNTKCEVKIILGKVINPEDCDIRINKLSENFWLSLYADNTWAYSILTEEDLFITCPNKQPKSFTLKDTGTLSLKPGCMAKTKTARFTALQEITTHTHIQEYNKTLIDIDNILRDMDEYDRPEITNAIVEAQTVNRQNNSYLNEHSLSTGTHLREIRERAHELSQYHRLQRQFTESKSIWSWQLIIIILAFISGTIITWKLLSRGGFLSLICARLFSGSTQRQQQLIQQAPIAIQMPGENGCTSAQQPLHIKYPTAVQKMPAQPMRKMRDQQTKSQPGYERRKIKRPVQGVHLAIEPSQQQVTFNKAIVPVDLAYSDKNSTTSLYDTDEFQWDWHTPS